MNVQLLNRALPAGSPAETYVIRLASRLFAGYREEIEQIEMSFAPPPGGRPGATCTLRLHLRSGGVLIATGAGSFEHHAAESAVEQGWTLLLVELRRRRMAMGDAGA